MYGSSKFNADFTRVRQPKHEHWIAVLNDSRLLLIRPLERVDRGRKFEFLRYPSLGVARASLRESSSEPSQKLIHQLMSLDHVEREAYVALEYWHGELREVGVTWYRGILSQQTCVCAVVVAESYKRCGLGRQLMIHLMDAARRNGFKRMSSLELASNVGVEQLLKGLGFTLRFADNSVAEMVHEIVF
jgi:GNAT superfamily N-acetyltransferase